MRLACAIIALIHSDTCSASMPNRSLARSIACLVGVYTALPALCSADYIVIAHTLLPIPATQMLRSRRILRRDIRNKYRLYFPRLIAAYSLYIRFVVTFLYNLRNI